MVIDQCSRRVTGFALFAKMPTSTEICRFLDRAIKRADARPKYVVSDKGKQFFCATFRSWCRQRGVRPRFGALGRSASIAVVERFIRSMKVECTRRIRVPFELAAMRHELACYVTWFNEYRPHQALSGKVPDEVYRDRAHRPPVFETRSMRAQAPNGVQPVNRLTLAVRFFEGRRHLPIVQLRPAA